MAIQQTSWRHKKSGREYRLLGILYNKTHECEMLWYDVAEFDPDKDPIGGSGYVRTRADFEASFEQIEEGK